MIRQRVRITGVAAAALAVAAVVAPSATAMPFGGEGRGLAFPADHPASISVRPNPDQQVAVTMAVRGYDPATTAVRPNPDQQVPAAHARRAAPHIPPVVAVRPNPDQQVPAAHPTPSAATPAFASTRAPGTSTGSSFDWAALLIGIGAGGLLGLTIGALGADTGRSRLLHRQRPAASS
jgi:hypothetical protein